MNLEKKARSESISTQNQSTSHLEFNIPSSGRSTYPQVPVSIKIGLEKSSPGRNNCRGYGLSLANDIYIIDVPSQLRSIFVDLGTLKRPGVARQLSHLREKLF